MGMMGSRGFLVLIPMWLVFLCLPETGMASIQNIGKLNLGFRGSQMTWIDNNGMILVSNNSNFAFGFNPTQNVTLFLLVVMHLSSQTVIWSANRASPVRNSDLFVFDDSGNAYLQSQGSTVWSSDTGKKGVAAMELRDSGNLVLVGNDSNVVWQSFSHPVDTLVSNQEFDEGMKLMSSPGSNNFTYSLEIKSGDMILSASFNPPQPYWALGKDSRTTINTLGGGVTSAVLNVNSWKFYDRKKVLIEQFIFSQNTDANATWIAVLGNNGLISFSILQDSNQPMASTTRIPDGECNTPAACDPYYVCHAGNMCQCPSSLPSSCKLGTVSLCSNPEAVELVDAGNGLSYFAIGFVPPASKTDLNGCKNLCLGNCTCAALFFDSSSGDCFLFDQIGSLRDDANGAGFSSYIKVLRNSRNGGDGGSSKKHVPIIIAIVVLTILIITGLVFVGIHFHKTRNKDLLESPRDSSEEDNFLEGLSGMPMVFSYKDLENATNDFSVKLGHGGFGSVYQGVLPDGTRVAVKKLEGIGQGKKEFRAEVSIIGRIHHLHLTRLKGFCAEGAHKLLVYEYMANGSLERWLFRNNGGFMLDWNARYNIALGTAKGLAYLHEDCDAKIVHCDIKPENVLLDDHFLAKVSDFGLAKLMNREQSHVFTTLRGTRGYLAPEWITSYAISEKSDVYSYGMVLLEIIGGRKNYDSSQSSEKSHFPSYAFKMNEEGKLKDIVDMKLKIDEGDERPVTAIRVALWCIQDDMHLRPPMTKVVQMLEGLCPVPPPPSSSPLGSRLYSCFSKSPSEECTSSGASAPSDYNSDAYLSAVRLSGPR
ncbi:PREDICTED: G-type lectin S-receptor-like serine/threonine-protein kinase SD2-5 [Ipomoea nil]|uniref:G-type lectin S-receptor-like serine/threonine-protein kinase SD2-5 n=1 Tax=Ipomoea nil TaxID=35883 RepID=UPI000900C964|nr:PREDICTED: G-type lectin S-receptor-like serine/threonine-protein kinase SD2-5 [Ipomoea nil]